MNLGPLATNPATVVQATTSTLMNWGVDLTGALNGETLTGTPTVTLTDTSTGTPVALGGTVSVSGNVVTCPVAGTSLKAKDVYWLTVVFSTTAGNTDTRILTINVPA